MIIGFSLVSSLTCFLLWFNRIKFRLELIMSLVVMSESSCIKVVHVM